MHRCGKRVHVDFLRAVGFCIFAVWNTVEYMYRKFIITDKGILRFGVVYQHRELLEWGETCPFGGGLWDVDAHREAVLLYGRSFAFGAPDFAAVTSVDWGSLGYGPWPLLFLPHWPSKDVQQPVGLGL